MPICHRCKNVFYVFIHVIFYIFNECASSAECSNSYTGGLAQSPRVGARGYYPGKLLKCTPVHGLMYSGALWQQTGGSVQVCSVHIHEQKLCHHNHVIIYV